MKWLISIIIIILISCSTGHIELDIDRESKIPQGNEKIMPEDDQFPPIVHSSGYAEPEPIAGPFNTAGAEDSPFMSSDGLRFFFFFTPDLNIPAEEQITDSVTGIWYSEKEAGSWTEPQRLYLEGLGTLDGCAFMEADTLWFGSVRTGNFGEVDIYKAYYDGECWTNVENAGELLNETYDIGEPHIYKDTMYYGAQNNGDYDIYFTVHNNGTWSEPLTVNNINEPDRNENLPFINSDGTELWFTGESSMGYTGPAVYRSLKNDTGWGIPEEIISNFAGEPVLDNDGNIIFVHHFFDSSGILIEADIYISEKQ
ncbi:MAG: hypothetical protein R6U31_04770 [bacterium]